MCLWRRNDNQHQPAKFELWLRARAPSNTRRPRATDAIIRMWRTPIIFIHYTVMYVKVQGATAGVFILETMNHITYNTEMCRYYNILYTLPCGISHLSRQFNAELLEEITASWLWETYWISHSLWLSTICKLFCSKVWMTSCLWPYCGI